MPAAAPAPLAVPAERPTPASRLPQPPTATRIDKPREEGAPAAKPVARVDAPESQLQPARAISPLPRRGIEAEARDAGPDAPPVHVRAVRSRPFGVPVHQELAFAARMKEDPAAETTGAHAPARHVPQPAPSVPVLRPEPSTPLEAPAELGVARPPTAFAVAVAPPETRPAAPDAPARPAAPVPPVAPEPLAVERPSAAARDIAIEVAGSNGRVEIRVAEREGEIRMAVHAPRGQLAGELRERLPELAHRLEQQGWSAETWHPERAAGPRSDSGTPGREAGSQSWGQAEDGRHGRQQQDRQPRPGWLAELEETEERSEPEWQAFQAG